MILSQSPSLTLRVTINEVIDVKFIEIEHCPTFCFEETAFDSGRPLHDDHTPSATIMRTACRHPSVTFVRNSMSNVSGVSLGR
jgi:hypothetical protein